MSFARRCCKYGVRAVAHKADGEGLTTDTANAKIAHDVVLDAVREAGFHDNLTVKGGVVFTGVCWSS